MWFENQRIERGKEPEIEIPARLLYIAASYFTQLSDEKLMSNDPQSYKVIQKHTYSTPHYF